MAATRGLGYLLSFAQSTYNAALMFPERRQRSNSWRTGVCYPFALKHGRS